MSANNEKVNGPGGTLVRNNTQFCSYDEDFSRPVLVLALVNLIEA
jgi:hypothetical protein